MSNDKKSILITGGCGFIGLNLIQHLANEASWQIKVLDNLTNSSLTDLRKIEKITRRKIDFYKGDIRNKTDIKRCIKNCDYVVHLAAQTDVIKSKKQPILDAQINIMGTINLLEAVNQAQVKKIVLASSAAALGEQEPPINELKLPQPISGYGGSKLATEAYGSIYANSFNLPVVVLRFSNVYGPWSFQKGSVIPKFIMQILNKQQVRIFGDGQQTRDFIFVDDISQAIYLSLTNKSDNKFSLFQVGTSKETSINKLFQLLKQKLTKKEYKVLSPIYQPARSGEILRNYSDINKIRNQLDFSPNINLSEGLDKTLEWFSTYNPRL